MRHPETRSLRNLRRAARQLRLHGRRAEVGAKKYRGLWRRPSQGHYRGRIRGRCLNAEKDCLLVVREESHAAFVLPNGLEPEFRFR